MKLLAERFCTVLKEIEQLAIKLEFFNFARMFRNGYITLSDETLPLYERLSRAYQQTIVFGGMGSWIDSPPFVAQDKGLEAEYDRLTDQLYDVREEVKKNSYLPIKKNIV